MRVFHIVPKQDDHPLEASFGHYQIQALTAQGVDNVIFFFNVRYSPANLLRTLWQLRQAITRAAPDLVHAQYGTITAVLAGLATSRPIVITYRGSDLNRSLDTGAFRSALQKLFSQIAALRAERIICVSQRLAGRLWWRRARAVVIPSGIDTDLFQPIERPKARQQLGWPDDELVVLFNVGLQPVNKRLGLASAAVASASRILGRTIRLHVLRGETDQPQMPVLMAAVDCLVVTSFLEGSPQIVQEAIACNLPVVSVDVGDVAERLAKVVPSFVVAADANELGSAIAKVIAAGQRSNGRNFIEEFSVTALAARIIGVYRECLPPAGKA